MIKEFIEFLKHYGVIGLAIAVVIGGKLNDFVSSLVSDLLMPVVFQPALKAAAVDDIRKLNYNGIMYGKVVGAYFKGHSQPTAAQLKLEPVTHPALAGLPSPWGRTDEWYGFQTNPRPNVTVLLTVDETTYAPDTSAMGPDHPVAWSHTNAGGRSFYTALGHTRESFTEPLFLAHLLGGIQWAAGLTQ